MRPHEAKSRQMKVRYADEDHLQNFTYLGKRCLQRPTSEKIPLDYQYIKIEEGISGQEH